MTSRILSMVDLIYGLLAATLLSSADVCLYSILRCLFLRPCLSLLSFFVWWTCVPEDSSSTMLMTISGQFGRLSHLAMSMFSCDALTVNCQHFGSPWTWCVIYCFLWKIGRAAACLVAYLSTAINRHLRKNWSSVMSTVAAGHLGVNNHDVSFHLAMRPQYRRISR